MDTNSKSQQPPNGLLKPAELSQELVYRRIAASATLNASIPANSDVAFEKKTGSGERDENHPLVRGI